MKAFWDSRSPRDRAILAFIAAFVALALFVALVALPVQRARARLAVALPPLRASIEALQRDALEVKRLRALPVVSRAPASPLASLASNGGGLPGAQVVAIDAARVRVTGADIGFAALLEWLGNAQATHGMRVESARLDALPAPGRVRAELVLSRI